jgi:hypothetical protein
MDMNWKFFIGSSILAVGLLFKAGAPLVPIVLGVGIAAFSTSRLHRTE